MVRIAQRVSVGGGGPEDGIRSSDGVVTDVLRVLMVEDSPEDAELITAALQHGGRQIQVERVDSASAMRAALATVAPDIITCDWSVPGFSAPAALAILKESGLDIPFIIVSGTVGEDLAVDAMRAGAHDYVLKDRLARLAPAVDRQIRDARARDAERTAVAALSVSDVRYQRIIESTAQGVWVIDPEGKTAFVNPRMAEMLGSTVADLMGRSPAAFLDEEGRRLLGENFALRRIGKSRQFEVRFVRSDGTEVFALIESTSALGPSGEYEGAFATVMDVTARRNAEQALRASEARLKGLWGSGFLLITISDLTGRIIDVNDSFLRVLGYSRDELLSGDIRWPDITPPEWREVDDAALGRLATTGGTPPWEKELIAKDGRRVPILAGAVMLEGPEGIAFAIDLTERKSLDRALYERTRITALSADVGVALTHEDTLDAMLQRCAEAVVKHLGAAFARIWTPRRKRYDAGAPCERRHVHASRRRARACSRRQVQDRIDRAGSPAAPNERRASRSLDG